MQFLTETRERYNRAVNAARELRAECEKLLNTPGMSPTDAAFVEKQTAWQNALDECDTLKDQVEGVTSLDSRMSGHTEFTNAADPVTPNAEHAQFDAAQRSTDDLEMSAWQRDYHKRTANADYHRAFNSYLRSLAVPSGFGQREKDVLQEGVDTLGGFLVPADRVAGIYTRMRQKSIAFGLTSTRNTTRDRILITQLTPAAGDDEHIYSSAFVGDWVPEVPASTAGEVQPTFRIIEIPVKKARTKTFITFDELADTEVDLMQFLQDDGGSNLALVVDKGILIGTGAAGQPQGLFTNPTAVANAVDVEGTTVNTVSNTTADRGSADKLISLVSKLPPQYAANASWLIHRFSEAKIRLLVDAQNRYLWQPGFAGQPNDLLGFPVGKSDFVPQDGVDGNKVLAFGDFNEAYVKALRMSVAAQIDPYTKSDVEQTILYLRIRMGGDVRNVDAYRLGKV